MTSKSWRSVASFHGPGILALVLLGARGEVKSVDVQNEHAKVTWMRGCTYFVFKRRGGCWKEVGVEWTSRK